MKIQKNIHKRRQQIESLTKVMMLLTLVVLMIGCSEITAPEDSDPPSTPANFTLLGGGDGQVRLRWSKNLEVDFSYYNLYRSVNNINNFSLLVQLTQIEYLDRFLEYDSTYYYYLTAIDKAGNESDETTIIDAQPLNVAAPQPPIFLIASGLNNPLQSIQEIRLSWTPPDIGDLLRYKIYRSSDSDFVANTNTLIDSTTIANYSDRFLLPNTKYYYKVIAVDKGFKESLASRVSSDLILTSPILISPANQTRFITPRIFNWASVENSVAYTVFVGKGPFSDVIWSSVITKDTEILYNGPALATSQVYYWWVGAYSREKVLLENGIELPATVNSYSIVNSFFSE
jgi:fibronectin type 3 domain-containing protein